MLKVVVLAAALSACAQLARTDAVVVRVLALPER